MAESAKPKVGPTKTLKKVNPFELCACSLCRGVPVTGGLLQCRNAHLICERCYHKTDTCPTCHAVYDKSVKIKCSKLVEVTLESLPVGCPFRKDGCPAKDMARREVYGHLWNCSFLMKAFKTGNVEEEEMKGNEGTVDQSKENLEAKEEEDDEEDKMEPRKVTEENDLDEGSVSSASPPKRPKISLADEDQETDSDSTCSVSSSPEIPKPFLFRGGLM